MTVECRCRQDIQQSDPLSGIQMDRLADIQTTGIQMIKIQDRNTDFIWTMDINTQQKSIYSFKDKPITDLKIIYAESSGKRNKMKEVVIPSKYDLELIGEKGDLSLKLIKQTNMLLGSRELKIHY